MKLKVLALAFFLGLSLSALGQSHDLIKVNNVEEFLAAIGSDRTIQLTQEVYDFSDYTHLGDSHYFFQDVYDGQELVIQNVSNMVIRSFDENKKAELITKPTYGNVIVFQDCKNVRLQDLVAGHGAFKGSCTGGVFKFERCFNVEIAGADLYGSGIEGLTGSEVSGLICENVTIRSCTYGIMSFANSRDLTFRRCMFRENQEFDLVNIDDCEGLKFEECSFLYNRTENRFGDYSIFRVSAGSKVRLSRCIFSGNNTGHLANGTEFLELDAATKTSGNYFSAGKFKE